MEVERYVRGAENRAGGQQGGVSVNARVEVETIFEAARPSSGPTESRWTVNHRNARAGRRRPEQARSHRWTPLGIGSRG
jgi:hypothetical protein